jgi:hypothetical protein
MSTHILHMDHGEWGLGVIIAIDENENGCTFPLLVLQLNTSTTAVMMASTALT